MSFGGSVQGMITAMKNNAALKKSRKKFKGLDETTYIYKKVIRRSPLHQNKFKKQKTLSR